MGHQTPNPDPLCEALDEKTQIALRKCIAEGRTGELTKITGVGKRGLERAAAGLTILASNRYALMWALGTAPQLPRLQP